MVAASKFTAMKMQTLLLFVLWIFYCTNTCISQDIQAKPVHSQAKDAKGSLSDAPVVPALLDSLLSSIKNTKINSQKADIYFRISRYYADRLKIDSALFYSEKIKEESEAGNYELGIAKYYLSRSHALFFRNIREPENLDKAIAIIIQYKDDALSGFAYRVRARNNIELKNIAQARKDFHAAITYFNNAGALIPLQFVYYEIGISFDHTLDTDSSAYYLILALKLAEKLDIPGRIFGASSTLGELYYVTDDLPNASRYLKYASDKCPPGMSNILVRNNLASYANCLLKLGEFQKAELVLQEYELINQKLGDAFGVIMLNSIKGTYHFHKKNYSEALQLLQFAYDGMYNTRRQSFEMKNIAYYRGRTEFAIGQYDSAIRHLLYALQLNSTQRPVENITDANLYISRAYENKGDKDSALYYFRIHDHLKDSLWTFRKEKAVIELNTRYETEKKEQRIQLLQRDKELDAYQLKSKMDEIEKQSLADAQKSQQLSLLSKENEISRLAASESNLAFDNQQKEMIKKQSELELMAKEKELQSVIAGKESQRKNFAYLAIAAILLFSGYVFYRYTQNKKLSNQLAASLVDLKQAQEQLIKTEKEKEGDKIRVRISRDIHDEVGATLSGVALFSEIAREKLQQQQQNDAQVYLDHITTNSKEMIEKMSDIVWTINPHNDSFERIIAKLQSYAVNLCAGKAIRLHLDMDEQVRLHSPSMQARKNIYMLMKEAINNAVKYSGGKNIFLALNKKGERIEIEIRDDGKGFDKNKSHEGNGLDNMRARAADLNANFTIDSTEGKGTHICLQFNIHPVGGQFESV